ncbi:hypothetical protein DB32_008872 [Sandaracinus amylolyticus]|uniref:Threonine efflux protein n=1 Tax=Sandaracinus amylolyticus TaxID=927083 RepID=A0A0F6WAQ2_9BACT|nr:hypothetical protein DB32_008872 [Sandaracinus amylolyticus]
MIAGAVLGAPLGPSGAVVASMMLSGRRDDAYVASAGVPIGHAVVAAIATSATLLASSALGAHERTLRIVAALLLVAIGVRLALAKPRVAASRASAGSIAGTFLLTVLNPTLLAAYALVTAGPLAIGPLAPGPDASLAAALVIVVPSATIGAALAFVGATALLDRLQRAMSDARRATVARGLAAALVVLGAVGLARSLFGGA